MAQHAVAARDDRDLDAEEEKTWANSEAMKPAPTIAIRRGSRSMRMIVSLVWNGTPDRRITSGATACEPVAMTTWVPVIVSAPPGRSTETSRGPVKVPRPR
ncbi:hypothetical protein GCM10025872_25230 [Barrientosiimonas endolithica]|uniref:Uncharacterized protein n=1 Tax=Barrientosiimonas endolithica TaxID=1535208 RepID=A0ABM8HD20_9MICO|nr:hypothetical protein GCM10025872_25230 [Barrientosiimonas endolithica]